MSDQKKILHNEENETCRGIRGKVRNMVEKCRLSGNQLKLIALVSMTFDHVGKELFPGLTLLQILGRLAFPIFAYMIAEGCRYTKNRRRHLLHISGLALLCQLAYLLAEGSLFQGILVTFSMSIAVIYVIDYAMDRWRISCGYGEKGGYRPVRDAYGALLGALVVCGAVYFAGDLLPILLSGTDYAVDYGIWGILLPVGVYFAPQKYRLPVAAAVLVVLCMELGDIQWYSLGALVLLALYNGRRGKANIKHLFFLYYPAHLAAIYLLGLLLR